MKKRGALFYIIDAFVAAGIIAVALTVVFSIFLNAPKNEYNTESLINYFSFFEETRVNSAPSATTVNLSRNGTLTNPRANLFSAITELAAKEEYNYITTLIHETTSVALEAHYNTKFVLINSTGSYEFYRKGDAASELAAKFLLSRRTASSFKQEPQITTTTIALNINERGDTACAPSACLYVKDTATNITDPYGCPVNAATANWEARCRLYEAEQLFGPVIYEVTIWT